MNKIIYDKLNQMDRIEYNTESVEFQFGFYFLTLTAIIEVCFFMIMSKLMNIPTIQRDLFIVLVIAVNVIGYICMANSERKHKDKYLQRSYHK